MVRRWTRVLLKHPLRASQSAQYEKLKRENTRLQAEVERLEKEVLRQKALRCALRLRQSPRRTANHSHVDSHLSGPVAAFPCDDGRGNSRDNSSQVHTWSWCRMQTVASLVALGRETERNEFSEAKDRLKHSWAADRDDFARVKDALKKKNADHHVQNGRLSQALKVWPSTSFSDVLSSSPSPLPPCSRAALLPVRSGHAR